MELATEKEASQFVMEFEEAYKPVGDSIVTRVAIDRCMYEGCHWINTTTDFYKTATVGRRQTNWNPDTSKLVATRNRIPPLIRESAAACFPESIEIGVEPPDRDMGIEACERAQILESATNIIIDEIGYLQAARDANFRRCIDGVHGIGLRIKTGQRMMKGRQGEYEEEDRALSAFTFDMTKLVLDPFIQSPDLWDHEKIEYREVWTADAIRRNFGVEIDENDLMTVGELCKLEMSLNRLSENRLYSNLPQYSKTKGAVVFQLHIKTGDARFDRMLVGIRVPKKNRDEGIIFPNWDDQKTPFGGNGLPLMLLHGARRPDSMHSMSDAFLSKDDQDRMNLLDTFTFRMLQNNAGFQWLFPKEAILGKDADNFRSQITNRVGGIIEYQGLHGGKPVPPPQLINFPSPQPFIAELSSIYEQGQRRMVHRESITSGAYKTHTTNETFQKANENANQVLGNRIREDIYRHEMFLQVVLGTGVKMAQEGSPSMLACMRRGGFDASDFAVVASSDPHYPSCKIKMRESSIRYASKEEKEGRMWSAVQAQAISPLQLRMGLAGLDIPLSDHDRSMSLYCNRMAVRVLLGDEWPGEMLGEYNEMLLSAFRVALGDRRCDLDPAAKERLRVAIQTQLAYTNMEMQQAAMAQQPPAPMPAEGGGQPGQAAETPQEFSITDLLTQLEGGLGGGSSTQPAAA